MGGFQNDPGVTQQEAGFGFNGRFWTESVNDPMTATPGGTQANSVLIDSMFCRFATVTTPGDGAKLPPAFGGPSAGALVICVVNDSPNAMQVFAQGTDTINGAAGSVGVTQMGKSVVYYQNSQAGKWVAQGLGSGYASGGSASFPTYSTQTGIVAHAGGTQALATLITGTQAQISVCATAADSVKLPPAMPGMEITLVNNGAQSMQVFGTSPDTINGAATGTGVAQVVTVPTIYYCFVAGNWITK